MSLGVLVEWTVTEVAYGLHEFGGRNESIHPNHLHPRNGHVAQALA